MTRLLVLAALTLALLLAKTSPAVVITVDDSGGADYLTIQEGVDAASSGDTVLVYPGTYSDVHDCDLYWWYPANVCIYQPITLRSLDGPEVTVIDGGGVTTFGIQACSAIVEGFTVTNAGWFEWWGAAICVEIGEVRGNICTDSYSGVSDNPWWYAARDAAAPDVSGRGVVVTGNTLEGNEIGISISSGGAVVSDNIVDGNAAGISVRRDAVVSGNVVTDNQLGIGVNGPMGMSIVDNEISGNTTGLFIRSPTHNLGAHYSLDLLANRVADNTETNIRIYMWDVDPGPECDITLGGSVDEANDILGAPVNLRVETGNLELRLDATYNFWGSVTCSTFVPLFDIHEDVPDTAVVFEPFVDETHTKVFEECESVPVEHRSWGRIKAIYR